MTPFTIHFKQQRDGKMSGEIKFKGHPCLTFTGKSWIQKPFYLNLVQILNISQTHEPKDDSSMGVSDNSEPTDLDDNN